MPQVEYEEAKFLEKALESPEFRAFYEKYRSTIPWRIHWVVNADVCRGKLRGCADHHAGECGVVLQRLPTSPEFIHILAHEMGHLTLDAEGFPKTEAASSAKYPFLAGVLNSNLHDALIEQRLGSSGFDEVEKYKKWSRDAREDMLKARAEFGERLPSNFRIERLLLALKHRLWWETIRRGETDPYFWQWFKKTFPPAARKVEAVFQEIKRTGYSDPSSMASALSAARVGFNMEEIVSEPEPFS